MTIEEKNFLDGFVESKDRTISDYNKVNSIFMSFLKENPPQEEWVPLSLKLIMYLRPETLCVAFNWFSDLDSQIKTFASIADSFSPEIKFALWSSELAYCANNKIIEKNTIRDIILHLDEAIRHTEDQKELISVFRKQCLGAIDSSSSLPNFFLIETNINEFHSFTLFVLSSIDDSSKMTEKQIMSGTMFENWFKYGVFSKETPSDIATSVISVLGQISSSYMLLTQRNVKLDRQCASQEFRIETLQTSCDVLTNRNNALSSLNEKLIADNEELKTTIKKLEDEKAGLEQMIEVIKSGNVQKNMTQNNKLADKLAVYYSDCKEAMNVEMSTEVGEILRDTLTDVFKILKDSGIPLEKG